MQSITRIAQMPCGVYYFSGESRVLSRIVLDTCDPRDPWKYKGRHPLGN